MLTVAVVGANGFIGSRTVEVLHLRGLAAVRPVVRKFASLARASRFDLDARVASALDVDGLAQALEGSDVVVSLVAPAIDAIEASARIAYVAAERAGVRRLVYVSSAAVHGQAPAAGTDERSPLRDRQPVAYNTARVRAERALVAARARGTAELVMLRPGVVFGPRSSWITDFADAMLAGSAYLVDDGEGVCNAIYVDNLVRAIWLAATVPGADGGVFLVGDAERVTWADLYRPIAGALGRRLEDVPRIRPPMDFGQNGAARPSRSGSATRVVASILPRRARAAARAAVASWRSSVAAIPSPAVDPPLETVLLQRCTVKLPYEQAARVLGYEPEVSFEDACRRTVAWLGFAGYPVVEARQ